MSNELLIGYILILDFSLQIIIYTSICGQIK